MTTQISLKMSTRSIYETQTHFVKINALIVQIFVTCCVAALINLVPQWYLRIWFNLRS